MTKKLETALLGALCAGWMVVGCGGEDSSDGGGGGGTSSDPTCTAELHFLQKDAYKETAGRSSSLWPPHTTTTFDLTCDGQVVASAFRANHGTEPGEVDANGEVYLVETHVAQVSGPRSQLETLLGSYQGCECGTDFLSLDALQDSAVQELVAQIVDYINAHLTCSGGVDAAGLADLLAQGDIDAVLAELPNCTWDSGYDWEGGLDEALSAIVAAAQQTLADYHVCNNDARLQAILFERFDGSGDTSACDGASPECSGPLWFYDPQ